MSSFLNCATGSMMTAGLMTPVDMRAQSEGYQRDGGRYETPRDARPWEDGNLWPQSRFSGSEMNCAMLSQDSTTTGKWSVAPLDGGSQGQKKIIGTTRDSTSAALGNCQVQGFLTSGDMYIGEVTSDPAGYFELPTPFAGAHYLVCYKAGSPDVAGTSVNTITPT